jgi:hypothetical protein
MNDVSDDGWPDPLMAAEIEHITSTTGLVAIATARRTVGQASPHDSSELVCRNFSIAPAGSHPVRVDSLV